jgi:GH25 family lysozyme M1 (1,4-beta-N-acetylmuramidase)
VASFIAASGVTNAAATKTPLVPPAGRYNVSAAHSPTLERLLAGTHAAPTQAAPTATPYLTGVDVSSQQHSGGTAIDWGTVAGAGYKFAFVKATEGSYYVNPYYTADAADARKAGLLTAAYHFAIPNDSSAVLQADLFVNAAGDLTAGGQTLPLIVDLEYDPYVSSDHTNYCYGLSSTAMVAWISAFIAEIHRRTGQTPVIYTIAPWWHQCTSDSTAFSADPLWVASPGGTSPTLPVGWTNWEYWQYTSAATVPGITGKTDVSNFSAANPDAALPAMQSNATSSAVSLGVRSLDVAAGQSLTWGATGLPPGTTIDPASGVISGTLPPSSHTYPVTVTATDAASHPQQLAFTWQVHGPVTLVMLTHQLTMLAGSATNQLVLARDGLANCSLSFTATGLPPGLSISPCGRITGWASRPGAYHSTISATDSSGTVLSAITVPWTVRPAPVMAIGRVRLALADKCLAIPAGITARIWTCGKSAGQDWQIAQNGAIRIGAHCLAELSTTSKAPVLRTCTNLLGQTWRLTRAGAIANAQSGLCVTDPGASGKDGTAVSLAFCAGTRQQAWTLPPAPLAIGMGRCFSGDINRRPTRLVIAPCPSTAKRGNGQDWTVAPDGTISVPGGCLTTAGSTAAPGTDIALQPCAPGDAAQRWQPMPGPEPTPGRQPMPGPSGTGTFLVNPATGLCLTLRQPSVSGSPLALGYCLAGYPTLTWRIG